MLILCEILHSQALEMKWSGSWFKTRDILPRLLIAEKKSPLANNAKRESEFMGKKAPLGYQEQEEDLFVRDAVIAWKT